MMKGGSSLLNSKYVDIVIAIFMMIFAYINFSNGKNGFGILFVILGLANILTAYLKHVRLKKEENTQK